VTPEGFRYQPDLITPDEERSLLRQVEGLPFRAFEFHGWTGRRRTVSFGWHYDFGERALQPAEPLPEFLLPLRDAAAAFADLASDDLVHALVTEYGPGAAIGWHRDKAVFDDVIGVSLLSPCRFRFRRKTGERWERVSRTLEPQSAYLLRGPSRTEWEHSIPAVEGPRYSITFRSLRQANTHAGASMPSRRRGSAAGTRLRLVAPLPGSPTAFKEAGSSRAPAPGRPRPGPGG
jgi:alkylated DNA repair dioxygenase AlkB